MVMENSWTKNSKLKSVGTLVPILKITGVSNLTVRLDSALVIDQRKVCSIL